MSFIKKELPIFCPFDVSICEHCGHKQVILGVLELEDGTVELVGQIGGYCFYCGKKIGHNEIKKED